MYPVPLDTTIPRNDWEVRSTRRLFYLFSAMCLATTTVLGCIATDKAIILNNIIRNKAYSDASEIATAPSDRRKLMAPLPAFNAEFSVPATDPGGQ
jgi:hypothetical protein